MRARALGALTGAAMIATGLGASASAATMPAGAPMQTVAAVRSAAPSSVGAAATFAAMRLARTPRSPMASNFRVTSTWSNVGPTPHFSGYDAKLHRVFVSNLAAGTLTVVNSRTGMPVGTVALGGTVHTVVVDNATQRVYVTDIQRGLLDIVNARTDAVIAELPVGAHLHGLAVSNRLHEAVVTDVALSKAFVVNTRTDTVLTPKGITVGANPWGVSINPWTDLAYVTNTGINPFGPAVGQPATNPAGDSVSVINLRTDQVVRTVTVGAHPWNVTISPTTDMAYVGVAGANTVAVINPRMRVVAQIPVGSSPHGVVLDQRFNTLYVNNSLSNTVSVINTRTDRVVATVPVGTQPQGISVNQRTDTAYVVNQASQSISVVAPHCLSRLWWSVGLDAREALLFSGVVFGWGASRALRPKTPWPRPVKGHLSESLHCTGHRARGALLCLVPLPRRWR